MNKILFFLFFAMILNAKPVKYSDYFGWHVLNQIPKRVIYLGTQVEVPAMLGIWDRVAGVSSYGFENEILKTTAPLKRLEKFPSDHYAGIDVARLKRMNIDLVITYPVDLKSIDFSKKFGIDFMAFRSQSIHDLFSDIKMQADVFGVQKIAYPRLEAMQKALNEIEKIIHRSKQKPKVMEIFYKPNQISGKKSMDSDLLRFGGVDNLGERYIKEGRAEVKLESIIKENPQIIFIWWLSPLSVEDVLKDQRLALVDAIKNRRVYKLPPIDIAGPRSPLIVLFIAIKSHPEIFVDFDLKGFLRRYYRDVFDINPILSGF